SVGSADLGRLGRNILRRHSRGARSVNHHLPGAVTGHRTTSHQPATFDEEERHMLTHRRLVIGASTLVVLLAVSGASISAFQAHASGRSGSGMGARPIMGPMQKVSQPAFVGYYDGHKDTYLSTDVSS